MTHSLTKTVKSYSPGTRVTVLNYTKAHTVFVSVFHTKEVLEISADEVVQLRERCKVVTLAEENHKQRYRRLKDEQAAVGLQS